MCRDAKKDIEEVVLSIDSAKTHAMILLKDFQSIIN